MGNDIGEAAANYYYESEEQFGQGQFRAAIESLSKAIELEPEVGEFRGKRAYAYAEVEDFRNAAADLTEAARLCEEYADQPSIAYTLGIWHGKSGNHLQAFVCLSRALELDPQQCEFYRARAAAACKLGEYGRANSDLDEAMRLNPGFQDAHSLRATVAQEAARPLYSTAQADRSSRCVTCPKCFTTSSFGRDHSGMAAAPCCDCGYTITLPR